MIRTYGRAPYRVVVVHGGPGALGSMARVARELSRFAGVAEPLQSKFDIAGLIEELKDQIGRVCTRPVTLIGHAWGAWLGSLYAAAYPEDVTQLVLVSCAPLDVRYSGQIMEQRRKRMTQGEWALFNGLLFRLDRVPPDSRNWLLEQLGALLDKTDHYDLLPNGEDGLGQMPVNGEMYLSIWPEAEALCESGELLRQLRKIQCPVHVIHGEHDPRPAEGVTVPLHANNIGFKRHLLPLCGHEPFRERHAAAAFYTILENIIRNEPRRG
ncbi:alpha/beta hydrolase [Oxalobacter sp. OttesenSCG-928-P03]|nr:alpha/beta hydrolase [Oxalobacter sp. OttesenSCG-928-P03]